MTGDPVAKGFSLATLLVTGAAALALMGALAYEVRPVAELDGLTITALLFGFFNALASLLWKEGLARRPGVVVTAVSEETREETREDPRVDAWPRDRRRALVAVTPRRQGPPPPLPFPDRRSPQRQDRRRLPGGGRRVTDLALAAADHLHLPASSAGAASFESADWGTRKSLEG